MFLSASRTIHQGHAKFSDESQEGQQVFTSLSAFLCDQYWPIYPWRCEEIATDRVLLQEIFKNEILYSRNILFNNTLSWG